MRRLLLPLLTVTLSTPALAKSLLLDVRGEVDSLSYNKDANTAGSTAFNLQTGRIDYKGEINDSLSGRVRVRFNADNETNRGLDSLTNQTDYAYLSHKMGSFSLTLGKFGSEVGGHETITDSMLMYYKSEASKALTANYVGVDGNTIYFTPMKYVTGAKLTYKMDDSTLSVMGFNNPDTDAASSPKQTRFAAGASYIGKFLDKKLQPVASYFASKQNKSQPVSATPGLVGTMEGTNSVVSAGLKWDDDAWTGQVDYIALESAEFNAADLTKLKLQTTVAELTYKLGQWSPRATYETSESKETPETAAETKIKISGFGVGTEFKPDYDQNMRYFLVYTQKDKTPDGGKKKTENHVLLGFSMSADLLK